MNFRKDGTPFWNEVSISVRNSEGQITHFIDYQIDVTERVHRELELAIWLTPIRSPDCTTGKN